MGILCPMILTERQEMAMKGKGGAGPRSIWAASSRLPSFESLRADIKTEVLVIGGGMAGLLCAYMLGLAGVDYVLVEADVIGGGATKNTTAKITSQHGLVYHKLIREFGTEHARLYLEANQEALKSYGRLCRGMDCDWEEKDGYVYSLDNPQVIERELKALEKLHFPSWIRPRTWAACMWMSPTQECHFAITGIF